MSSWTCVTFEAGDRPPEAVAADLRRSLTETDERICQADEQQDPYVTCDDERVIWYVHGLAGDAFDTLDVPCAKALALHINDTTEAGYGNLYEWIDGEFVQTDGFSDDTFGRTMLDYFYIEHGVRGERRV